jgi:hypothetical protein
MYIISCLWSNFEMCLMLELKILGYYCLCYYVNCCFFFADWHKDFWQAGSSVVIVSSCKGLESI